jgi:hypothetical protein
MSGWNLVIFGLILLSFIIVNVLMKYLPKKIGKFLEKTIIWISYGFVILLILGAILSKEYWNLLIIFIILIAQRINGWFKRYDSFVDRKIDKMINK